MSELHLIDSQAALLRDLTALAAQRAAAESAVEAESRERSESGERSYRNALKGVQDRQRAEAAAAEHEHGQARAKVLARFETEHAAAQAEYQETKARLESQGEAALEAAQTAFEEARWQATTGFEAERDRQKKHFDQIDRQFLADLKVLEPLQATVDATLEDYARFVADAGEAEPMAPEFGTAEGPLPTIRESITTLDALLVKLLHLGLPKFVKGWLDLMVDAGIWLLLAVALWAAGLGSLPVRLGIATGATLVIAVALRVTLRARARAQVAPVYKALCQALADSVLVVERGKGWGAAKYQERRDALQVKLDEQLALAGRAQGRKVAGIEQRRDDELAKLEARHSGLLAKLDQVRDDDLRKADERREQVTAAARARYEEDSKALHDSYRRQREQGQERRDTEWNALADRWGSGVERVKAGVEWINAEDRRIFPDWADPLADGWRGPTTIPPAARFGTYEVALAEIPKGIAKDPKLRALAPERFTLPALAPFPGQGALMFKAGDPEGRDEAVQALQAVMLRLLTTIPPGKVRFTIIDPVGLGQNFAAFMHLTDFDEALVTSRIWTETPHIEQRLADLTEHMERVIQKYLRNEYETIEEYNRMAGEVAEPFRVLVVANFPDNFSESAARRLASIVSSGARCGVFTLLSVDTRQQMPSGCDLKDLESHSVRLAWKEGRFVRQDEELGRYPLTVDAPPDPETFVEVVKRVGHLAKDANRVEVPFEVIAPSADRWWTSDSRPGIDVPLGRVGATRLQNLKLGRGTSQHVLIAGRTGSGKSTLLHALITNLALHYSPDEVELYLIDFKKGVEFQSYAVNELPHARVIAVESEREFGLSVLQRLDSELRLRGEKFRSVGAQDLASYRNANGDEATPRILLIVDEFQEFFVEDDKVAQEAALLLDRLVRQGRAFGIHVHLGSQTLSGAYSLARSTLGQMAVRIALQCSESDAHLILSEDNSAARLLSRPGEAIYNDANGMVEGNHFFQVVWLSDDKKEQYLRRLRDLDRARNPGVIRPRLVFEGNTPADVRKNHLLMGRLRDPARPARPRSALAWLGEAIAIKDPTAAVFRPQGGANLLIIGQQDVAALGIMTTALIGLAAQYAPPEHDADSTATGVRFYALDGTPVDSAHAGAFQRLVDVIPHPLRVGGVRDLAEVVGEVAEEVDRRSESPDAEVAPIYLLINDLSRFRELRKGDDDFGFSKFGDEEKAASPAKQLGNVLREGPALGVHTIIWCDSLNNVNRSFDRQALREFELRVLFQMSANDSSALIDTPVASRLGQNRAFFHSEEEGRLEKFRPYSLPDDAWLAEVRDQLRERPVAAG
ncbi:MAG TPA: FtsK/SpoIIIE domain-containing protein [Isosphaeraceae bacterium]|nr:FtsK/SpoIIIE domain-containing protein [Isosphaeraceae bacterium]